MWCHSLLLFPKKILGSYSIYIRISTTAATATDITDNNEEGDREAAPEETAQKKENFALVSFFAFFDTTDDTRQFHTPLLQHKQSSGLQLEEHFELPGHAQQYIVPQPQHVAEEEKRKKQ